MRRKKHGYDRLTVFSDLLLHPQDYGNPTEQWDDQLPCRLEIGCGKGDFIRRLSRKEPEYHYYAMEKILDVLVIAVEKYARDRRLGDMAPNGGWISSSGELIGQGETMQIPVADRGNVRFILDDAEHLSSIFASGSVETIYLNFSDPWPKKGNADRRLTSPRFLKEYERLLPSGGFLRMKTDNEQLFDYSLETVSSSGLVITAQSRDLYSSPFLEGNIATEYESNFVSQGKRIHYLEAVKR